MNRYGPMNNFISERYRNRDFIWCDTDTTNSTTVPESTTSNRSSAFCNCENPISFDNESRSDSFSNLPRVFLEICDTLRDTLYVEIIISQESHRMRMGHLYSD